MKLKLRIDGLDLAFRKLLNLEKKGRKKAVKAMVNAGGKVLLRNLKRIAKTFQDTRTYERSLGSKVVVYRNSGVAVAIVGPRKGWGRETAEGYRDPIYYAHLIEFGERGHPGHAPLRKVLDSSAAEIRSAMISKAIEALEASVKNA